MSESKTTLPFRGAGPVVQSVAGGHNPLACVALAPAVPLIQNGQLRGLGLTSAKRFSTVPGVPTMAEQGIAGQESTTMQAFLAPAKTPKPIVDLLHREMIKVVKSPGMEERFTTLGFTPIGNSPAESAAQIQTELARWAKVIGEAHIAKM
ncbi:tripartite tricarboxylate transporter substrate-binding protein [Rhodoplanes sp. TEM]|uniref:Tripartite tricarboxylate transporter substrate-binding protein n=1 Tax=Rhodoplanes tepidamans TaxID=200616 RepID=A0ABT5JHQ4_RHOTP|nr:MULTISPECIES: tripartite tricarboxylate transporter substrate-binding protein [Rhodoplanes]MDC7789117.1 tripartite tricarboxylate transporter substrate-binding protein [Rhodoplanes tepidamans]MDC7982734.1 tripartite tricarboxylate transporter substrate-binding protein [Rhodoplanes sp. TEM]MDQ0357437.1 tripartite-type tricarboxylate transporter receptor subunit TctC [Rhodoplanes tepidamans]